MPPTLLSLTAADFDAYLPERATSNAFVRARIPVKDKLVTVARALVERIRERTGIDLEVVGSDERPSIWNKKSVTAQWVFLWRNREARAELEQVAGADRPLGAALADPTPFDRHAFVALHLTAQSFEIAFQMHRDAWADVTHLRGRLDGEAGRAAIDGALRSLTDGFEVGVTEGGARRPARDADAEWVRESLGVAASASSAFVVSRGWSRTEAIEAGDGLWDRVVESVDALVPVYQVMTWRRDADEAVVAAELDRRRADRDAQAAAMAARTAEWQANHDAEIERRREQATIETRERVAALVPSRPAAVQAATAGLEGQERPREVPPARPRVATKPPVTNPAPTPRPNPPSTPPNAPAPTPVEWTESDAPVLPGARVRVNAGPFEGKTGLVIAIDSKGQAKVLVGAVSVRVESGLLTRMMPKT